MSEEAIDLIRETFHVYDTNDDGLIDMDEFLVMIDALYPGTSASYLESGFFIMDQNQDGYIDLQEFLDWWQGEDLGELTGR